MNLDNYKLEITPETHHVTVKITNSLNGSEFLILTLPQVYELQRALTIAASKIKRVDGTEYYKNSNCDVAKG